ncbi:subtilisin-like serine protease [Bellilinea caldifistulae]|uniref:S8 family serine peptidase n=1 Tax=Bellilinea caldifistulae TaxID=360411 RepID=UPI000785EFE1|nr:S8 family serine peptidase [Bellilinea caldifistulae]GAP12133.1 subtilisin-like serine protease [Bellilinea caldifistulae]
MKGRSGFFWIIAVWIALLSGWLAVPPRAGADSMFTDDQPPVDIEVLREIQEEGSADYWITFDTSVDLSPAMWMDWEERGRYVYEQLTRTAQLTQARVQTELQRRGVRFQSFWIQNAIYVEGSNQATLQQVLNYPEIQSIRAPRQIYLHDPQRPLFLPVTVQAVEDNLSRIQAPQVWNIGVTGRGLTVANIDTGVHYTHRALINAYRGNLGGGNFSHDYNWFDPYTLTGAPLDNNGHGTHTMGIMVGKDGSNNQIGVAPGADWIACRGCKGNTCGEAQLLACAQFVLAPTRTDATQPNPDLRPHVVNNSWGDCGRQYDNWFQNAVNAWLAAGIYPVFSNGNAGGCGYPFPPGLNTVGNPARYGNVTGVGSSGKSNGEYAAHSNWGPTDNPDTINPRQGFATLKPQVLAPGVSIRSAYTGTDTAYANLNGTSMSAPHVAGLVALIWQAAPCLVGNYALTETIIEQTATPVYYDDGSPATPTNLPNYAAGWGEINALAAVQEAQRRCTASANLQGLVRGSQECNVSHFMPIHGATITVYPAETPGQPLRITTTAADGTYRLTLSAGNYRLMVSAPGMVAQETNVSLSPGQTLVQNFDLMSDHPCLQSDVSVLQVELLGGEQTAQQLTLSNSGWQETLFSVAKRVISQPSILADGGFELGTTSESPWQQYSRLFGTPLCSVATCGGYGTVLPHSGQWWAWFGGATQPEEGWLEQRVTIPPGRAFLRYYLQIKGCGSPNDFIQISMDDNVVWELTTSGIKCWESEYSRREVDLSAFADGQTHRLQVYSLQTTSATTNIYLDDLLLWQEADWLQVEPQSGSLPPGSTIPLNLTVNSAGLPPGMHRAVIELRSGEEILSEILVEVKVNAPYQYYFPFVGNGHR